MCDELACDDVLIYTCAWTLAYELTSRVLLICDINFFEGTSSCDSMGRNFYYLQI